MWNWATPERARRGLWVMYKRLTTTSTHKFYTLTLLITFLPLFSLHLLALHNTSTGLTKLTTLLSFTSPSISTGNSSSNSWEGSGSLVPTVIQQDGQGVLRVCNNARDVCESVTAVALSATVSTPTTPTTSTSTSTLTLPSSTPLTAAQASQTPQQVASAGPVASGGLGGSGGIAGDEGVSVLNTNTNNTTPISSPTSSIPPSPDVVVQAGPTPRPPPTGSQLTTTTTSSSFPSLVVPLLAISSQPAQPSLSSISQESSQVSSVQADGVLNAAPPPPPPTSTLTSADPSTLASATSGGTAGLVVGDVPLVSTTTTTSTSTSSTSTSTPSTRATPPSLVRPDFEGGSTTTTTTTTTNDLTREGTTTEEGSTDLAVGGNEGPTSTDTTSTSSTSPNVDSTTESPADVPTTTSSSSSILSDSDKGDVEGGGNGGSTSIATSTSTTLTTTSNSDESTPTETTSTDNTSTDSTPTESKESKESSTMEPSSSDTKETGDEPTSTSTASSSGVPDIKWALSLQRRYTRMLYGSPGSAFPLQARSYSSLQTRTFSATPITNGTTGTLEGVDVTDVSDTGENDVTRLGVVCAISMAFPLSQLRQDWIEDITMAAFYLCILGVGIAATINESVAHLVTAFLSTLLSFLWTSTQLVRTHYAHDQFDAFITRSACSGVDVLPYYWSQRQRLELPILIINVLALVLLAGLGFKLLKVYKEDTKVKRYVYKVMLVLRCSILLGSFLLFSGTGIWLNFLFTNPGVVVSGTVDMLKGLAIVSLVFGLPWAGTGWFALREAESLGGRRGGKWWGKRMMMGVFVGLNVLFLAGWVATFASDLYRAVFLAWTFFAVVSVAAFFVLVGSLGAGVVCWMRFGRDLDDFDSEKPRGVSVFSTESFGNPVGHLSNSNSHRGVGSGGGGGLEVPRWDYSNTAEKAWEPFDEASIRQSQFTASDGRESTVFSYGLRSPAPPVPVRPDAYGSSGNPSVAFGLAL